MKILPVVKSDKRMLRYAERCKASWDYFHPDIPMHIVLAEDWIPYITETYRLPIGYREYSMFVGQCYAIQKMMTEHYELFIYLDADIVVTGRCEEMLVGDYDIAVSEGFNANFYNAGVWSTTNLAFIKEFFYTHLGCSVSDNWVFMFLINHYKGRHVVKVLDDENSDVWYNERSREWWNRLDVRDDRLHTPDRQVKMLHWAGGSGQGVEDRLSCSLFSEDVKKWLNKITNTTDFTDYDGIKFGDFIKRTYGLV
jgi:hypothetical protein